MKKFYYSNSNGYFECFFVGEVVFYRCFDGPARFPAYRMMPVIEFFNFHSEIELYDTLDSFMDEEG